MFSFTFIVSLGYPLKGCLQKYAVLTFSLPTVRIIPMSCLPNPVYISHYILYGHPLQFLSTCTSSQQLMSQLSSSKPSRKFCPTTAVTGHDIVVLGCISTEISNTESQSNKCANICVPSTFSLPSVQISFTNV